MADVFDKKFTVLADRACRKKEMEFEGRQRRCKSRLPFGCKYCPRRFSSASELQLHNKRHKKQYPKRQTVLISPDDEERVPIPKVVIRRNSSPIKRNGETVDDVVYEIVDLASDDNVNEDSSKLDIETSAAAKTTEASLCSPSQKDSGIDDSSPHSCDEARVSSETAKVGVNEPIYSPYLGVEKHANITDNHNSAISNSCDTIDKSQSSPPNCQGDAAKLESTVTNVNQCVTVNLPPVTEANLTSGGNGFITIDLNHLNSIVGAGSVTDAHGNISVTLEPGSEVTRNIFDAIAKSGSDNTDEYVPSPKKARRSSDFDTGDSQFNFYDSNKGESLPVIDPPMFTDSESDSDPVNGYSEYWKQDLDSSIENEVPESCVETSKQTLCNHDVDSYTRSNDGGDVEEGYDTDSNSQSTIAYTDQAFYDSFTRDSEESYANTTSSAMCGSQVSNVNSFDKETGSLPLLTGTKEDSPSKYQSEFTKFLCRRSASDNWKKRDSDPTPRTDNNIFDSFGFSPRSSVKKVKVSLEDGRDLPSITKLRVQNKTEKSQVKEPTRQIPLETKNHKHVSPNQEIHTIPFKQELQHFIAMEPIIPPKLPGANEIRLKTPINELQSIKLKQGFSEYVQSNTETQDNNVTLGESLLNSRCGVPGPRKGPFQTVRSIKSFCTYSEKLVSLRKQVMCLLHVLFPRLEFPSYFRSGGVCVDVLLDEIVAILEAETNMSEIRTLQSIPLENACCNVRVLVCQLSALTCLRNFRKKICRFLQHVLPQLQLNSSFQRTGENVDELLYQVIECNSSR